MCKGTRFCKECYETMLREKVTESYNRSLEANNEGAKHHHLAVCKGIQTALDLLFYNKPQDYVTQ